MLDARGLSCPEPVIMIKNAMASKEASYEIMVDNRTALENITRFATHAGYNVTFTEDGDDYKISIKK